MSPGLMRSSNSSYERVGWGGKGQSWRWNRSWPRRRDRATSRLPTRATEVGRLGTDDVLAVLLNRRGAGRGVHFADVLFRRADHASAGRY